MLALMVSIVLVGFYVREAKGSAPIIENEPVIFVAQAVRRGCFYYYRCQFCVLSLVVLVPRATPYHVYGRFC